MHNSKFYCSSGSHWIIQYMSLGALCSAVSVKKTVPADTETSVGPLPPRELQCGKGQIILCYMLLDLKSPSTRFILKANLKLHEDENPHCMI